MIRARLYKVYWALQRWIVPELRYAQHLYEEVLWEYGPASDRWLDFGCGHHLLPPWRLRREKELVGGARFMVGLDVDQWSLTEHQTIEHRLRADGSALPFADGAFDLITSNMVFEHLDDPRTQLGELARIMKPGGRLIFHTPNTKGYFTVIARLIPEGLKPALVRLLQGRKAEDLFPAHYRINSPQRVEELAGACGLEVERIRLLCTAAETALIIPLAALELLWIRFLMTRAARPLRTNMIAVLRKPAATSGRGA